MVTLDNFPSSPIDRETARMLAPPDLQWDIENDPDQETLVNQALLSAVHAFSARWLPAGHFRKGNTSDLQESIAMKEYFVESIRTRAHQDVVRVLTRPSYRSILALYLFGTTPTSRKSMERRMPDHCFETALRHYVHLRAKAHILTRSPLMAPNQIGLATDGGFAKTKAEEEYDHLRDTAYWFGIVIDGSRALTRCRLSVLLPGFNGESQVWDHVRKQSENFDAVYRPMRPSRALLTDETVMTMIQYGSSCKTLFWKAVSRLQEYLVFHAMEVPLQTLLEKVVQEMDRFENVFGPFLDKCGRDYILLSEKSRISYLILSLHFHLGVLILVDTLEALPKAHVAGQFLDVKGYRISSTRTIVNLIHLMLQQTESHNCDATTSIILRDPYPEHTRNALARAGYSVLNLYDSMSISKQAAEIMASSLLAGLEVLTQVSYIAAESLSDLHKVYAESDLVIKRREIADLAHLTVLSSAFETSVSPEMFDDETVKQLDLAGEDPRLVDKTIERHEVHNLTQDFVWNDFSEIDFSAFTQDWAFEDCFSS
ncbi:hypothetical protein LTR44_005973 [Exophiala sp. CCFEE 6388]|nr:hypothetical protein LTR44_005973 [Eurotiomycetes sp. CCFEE 6388]